METSFAELETRLTAALVTAQASNGSVLEAQLCARLGELFSDILGRLLHKELHHQSLQLKVMEMNLHRRFDAMLGECHNESDNQKFGDEKFTGHKASCNLQTGHFINYMASETESKLRSSGSGTSVCSSIGAPLDGIWDGIDEKRISNLHALSVVPESWRDERNWHHQASPSANMSREETKKQKGVETELRTDRCLLLHEDYGGVIGGTSASKTQMVAASSSSTSPKCRDSKVKLPKLLGSSQTLGISKTMHRHEIEITSCVQETSLLADLTNCTGVDGAQVSDTSGDTMEESQCVDMEKLPQANDPHIQRASCHSLECTITPTNGTPASSGRAGIRRSGKICEGVESFRCLESLAFMVKSSSYGYLVCLLLLINAVTIGLEVHGVADGIEGASVTFRISETCFCILFTLELALRVVVYRRSFFIRPALPWNMFDLCTVGLQLIELIMTVATSGNLWGASVGSAWVVKLARALQLLRIFRVLRIVHFVRDLNMLVYLIFASLWSFVWTVGLLVLLTYILGVFITQLVVEQGHFDAESVAPGTEVHQRFGSIPVSILSLYQAISGGIDWKDLVEPLSSTISPALVPVFVLYVAFAALVILNLVTGVFVEGAHKLTRDDRERELLRKARSLFTRIDNGEKDTITWGEFRAQLEGKPMRDLFNDIDLGLCKPDDFFWLLDRNDEGQINTDTFMQGVFVLGRPARAIDTALILRQTQDIYMYLQKHCAVIEHKIFSGDESCYASPLASAQNLFLRTGA